MYHLKRKVTMIDPPSGWMYGFPKPLPEQYANILVPLEWWLEQGYPQELIDRGMLAHVRRYKVDIEGYGNG